MNIPSGAGHIGLDSLQRRGFPGEMHARLPAEHATPSLVWDPFEMVDLSCSSPSPQRTWHLRGRGYAVPGPKTYTAVGANVQRRTILRRESAVQTTCYLTIVCSPSEALCFVRYQPTSEAATPLARFISSPFDSGSYPSFSIQQ